MVANFARPVYNPGDEGQSRMTHRTVTQTCFMIFICALLCLNIVVNAVMPVAAAARLEGDINIHDPSLIKQGDTYYLFSTGDSRGVINQGNVQIRKSNDLINWRYVGTVFPATPEWITAALGFRPRSLWAPDISYFNGKYHLYYAGSGFGTNNSVIGLATNTTLDAASPSYKWVDEGEVIRSKTSDNWNAIDPQLSFDSDNNPWMSLGSFWDGIKMRRIEASTGKLSSVDTKLYSLASRGGGPIEAPSIIRRKNYYYQFVSFDFCCRKANSTYKIMVGRATTITGPYTDREGRRMDKGGGDLLLAGYDRYRGTGGQSVYLDGNTYRLILHYYDARDAGAHKLQLRELAWTADDWPVAAEPLGTSRSAVGLWSFDDAGGETATDSSGSENNGTLVNGPTWTSGALKGALSFNGTNGYVDIGTNVIDLSGSFTVAAWVRLDRTSADHTAVSQDGGEVSGFYLERRADTGKFAFTMTNSDSTAAASVAASSKTSAVVGRWYRLVGVRDARARQLRLYVNGVLEGEAPVNTPWWASGHTVIGRALRGGKQADFWPGAIDDVRLYDRALSRAEIKSLSAR
jgi:arabinan endo-1,5-alpha-L-arabinosidase